MKLALKHDVTATLWASALGHMAPTITLPKGAEVIYVGGGTGGYAIEDSNLIAKLSGDEFNAWHRYVWVNKDDVEEIAE